MTRIAIPVSGMHCAACSARVQKALLATPGVQDAAVNLMMNDATVTFDPAVASPAELVDAIQATGYGAALPTQPSADVDEAAVRDEAQRAELSDLKRKAVASGIVGVGAMLLSMPLMQQA